MPYTKLLKNISINCTLTPEQESELLQRCSVAKYKKKSSLIHTNAIDEHIYFVNKGIIKCCILNEAREEFIISFSKAESWIGDMNTFATRKPAIATFRCVTEVEAVKIPLDTLENLMKENTSLAYHFRYLMQNRILSSQMDRYKLISLNAEDRYKDFITNETLLAEKVALKDVASYLGIFPESLSRIRRKFLNEQ